MMKNDHLPRPQNNCHQKFCCLLGIIPWHTPFHRMVLVLPFFDGCKIGYPHFWQDHTMWLVRSRYTVCMLACISPPNDGFSTLAFRTYPCAPTPGSWFGYVSNSIDIHVGKTNLCGYVGIPIWSQSHLKPPLSPYFHSLISHLHWVKGKLRRKSQCLMEKQVNFSNKKSIGKPKIYRWLTARAC